MIPTVEKAFNLMGGSVIATSTVNEKSKKRGEVDQKWQKKMVEARTKRIKDMNDKRRAEYFMERRKIDFIKILRIKFVYAQT